MSGDRRQRCNIVCFQENDYIENYFDNGEGYVEDSEENPDDDAVF